MKPFKKYCAIAIIIFLVLYVAFAIYLKMVARELTGDAIAYIKRTHPEINQIQYGQTDFSPYDFFKEQIAIEHITVSLNNSNAILQIGKISSTELMGLKQDPFSSFGLEIDDLSVNSFPDLYATLATWSNSAFLYDQLENIPPELKLNLHGQAHYDAPNQTLAIALKLSTQDLSLLNYDVTLSHLPLSRAFFSDPVTFSNSLNAALITEMNYSADINASVNTTALQGALPIAANLLQNMGYTTLPIQFQMNSNYNAADHHQIVQARLNINNLGALSLNTALVLDPPPSPGNFASFVLNPNATPSTDESSLIQSASLTYTDASFLNRLLQFLANTTGQSIGDVQTTIQTNLENFVTALQIPQLESIGNTLADFLANPGTLTVSLNPAKPFSVSDVSHFFTTQQKMNAAIQSNLNKLSNTQKEVFFDRYQSASTTAYSNFLNEIGLSVTAN